MPGLIRGVARTAVIAGTATSVSNRVSRRQASRWAAQEQVQQAQAAPQVVYAAPVAPPPPPSAAPVGLTMEEKYAQLRQIAELRDEGILTEAEFEVQKAKILNS